MKEREWYITYFFRNEDDDSGLGSVEYSFISKEKLTSSELKEITEDIKKDKKYKSVIIINVFELEKEWYIWLIV